jgi:glycosyltransferase involved in cell wall biosynthesis
MKVLVAHNRYRNYGGEDAVFDDETRLLEQEVEVIRYEADNQKEISIFSAIPTAIRLPWSRATYRKMVKLIRREKPSVAHFFNLFPLITASAYDACFDEGIPVVQMLQNFRPWCANGLFLREGKTCEECVHHGSWRSVRYGCYRGSRLATAAVARMQNSNFDRNVWRDKINICMVPTEFMRRKVIDLGIPEEKVVIKPNFVLRPPGRRTSVGENALYVGRLSSEKGVPLAIDAFRKLAPRGLDIIGSGPEERALAAATRETNTIRMAGRLPVEEVHRAMLRSSFLILPSICYEVFPRVLVEAMSLGVPVVASRWGGIPEIVREGETGLLFERGNAEDLAEKARRLFEDEELNLRLGRNARERYERLYTPEINLRQLLEIYRKAMSVAKGDLP